jgi:hypothetical protein
MNHRWSKALFLPLFAALLVACPIDKITGIDANATPSTIASGATSSLTATVTGTGAFNPSVNWSIMSGDGSLSSNTGSSVTYTAPTVTSATTVQIKATAAGDSSISKTLQVTVQAASPPPPGLSINTFTAAPSNLSAAGEVMLEWDVTGATSLELDGVGVAPPDKGSKKINVTKTRSFVLKASNANSSTSKSVDVTVNLGSLQPGVWDQSNWNEANWQ